MNIDLTKNGLSERNKMNLVKHYYDLKQSTKTIIDLNPELQKCMHADVVVQSRNLYDKIEDLNRFNSRNEKILKDLCMKIYKTPTETDDDIKEIVNLINISISQVSISNHNDKITVYSIMCFIIFDLLSFKLNAVSTMTEITSIDRLSSDIEWSWTVHENENYLKSIKDAVKNHRQSYKEIATYIILFLRSIKLSSVEFYFFKMYLLSNPEVSPYDNICIKYIEDYCDKLDFFELTDNIQGKSAFCDFIIPRINDRIQENYKKKLVSTEVNSMIIFGDNIIPDNKDINYFIYHAVSTKKELPLYGFKSSVSFKIPEEMMLCISKEFKIKQCVMYSTDICMHLIKYEDISYLLFCNQEKDIVNAISIYDYDGSRYLTKFKKAESTSYKFIMDLEKDVNNIDN